MISGTRKPPPISTSSPRDTMTSRPRASAASASSTAAALLFTTIPASAPHTLREQPRRHGRDASRASPRVHAVLEVRVRARDLRRVGRIAPWRRAARVRGWCAAGRRSRSRPAATARAGDAPTRTCGVGDDGVEWSTGLAVLDDVHARASTASRAQSTSNGCGRPPSASQPRVPRQEAFGAGRSPWPRQRRAAHPGAPGGHLQ